MLFVIYINYANSKWPSCLASPPPSHFLARQTKQATATSVHLAAAAVVVVLLVVSNFRCSISGADCLSVWPNQKLG